VVEGGGLDGMDQLGGFSFRRNEKEPPASTHLAGGEAEDAVGDGVQAAEVIEEPAVKAGLFELSLHLFEFEGS